MDACPVGPTDHSVSGLGTSGATLARMEEMFEPETMTGVDLISVKFHSKWRESYDPGTIDEFLELVAERIDAGISPVGLVNELRPRTRRRKTGYDPGQVEQLLDLIVREFSAGRGLVPPISDSASGGSGDPWRPGVRLPRELEEVPGTRLSCRHENTLGLVKDAAALTNSEGEVLAKVKPRSSCTQGEEADVVVRDRDYKLHFVYFR